PLDYLITPQYVLTVRVTDAGGTGAARSDTALITLNVTQNNHPTADDATYGITEGIANNTVVGGVNASDPDTGAGWSSPSWQYRKQLTLDGDLIAGNLTDFPLLVQFPVDAELAAHARTNGWDIFFTAADGVT